MRHLKSPVVPWLRGNEGCRSARARLPKLGTLARGCLSLAITHPDRDALCVSVYSLREMSLQIAQELYSGSSTANSKVPF